MTNNAFFCELSHEGVLSVQGPDASKFLQGQLTCNLNYLNSSHSSLGARCNAKGRMLSSFRILPHADGFLLAMDQALLEAQHQDLKKYAVFSKVQLSDASEQWLRIGLSEGDQALHALGLSLAVEKDSVTQHEQLLAVRLSTHRCELWIPSTQKAEVIAKLHALLPEQSLNAWFLGQIADGLGQVFASTREVFIPQMINLQALGGVSFKKGCYTGQEIVARMQYLGKLKRRMYRVLGPDIELPAPGCEIFSPVHNSSVGEVVLAASSTQGTELLAVLQEDAVNDGRVFLGQIDGPALTISTLPYVLDRDAEIQR